MAFGIGVNKSTGNAAGRSMGARSPDGFSLSSNAVGKSIGGWLQNQALPWFSNLASQVDPNLGAAIIFPKESPFAIPCPIDRKSVV